MLDSSTTLSVLADASVAAELAPIETPQMLGGTRYRLEELIGVGPRAWVYRAVDTALARGDHHPNVAVKIFRGKGVDPGEAYLARRVEHPNVVRVLDRGVTEEGLGYVVSEFVSGGDLTDLGAPLQARHAVEIVRDLARAIQAAHNADVIHCDLKPQNVLVGSAGEVKVADFDLAIEQRAAEGSEGKRGNLAFMAPEQLSGKAVSPASDVYGLGGLLWFLLSGTYPNGDDADGARDVLAGRRERPTIHAPAVLRELLGRALSIDRASRYRSAGELADDLDRWLRRLPILSERLSASRRIGLWCRRRPAAAIGAVAALMLGVAGIVGWVWWERASAQRELAMQADVVREANAQVDRLRSQVGSIVAQQIASLRAMRTEENLLPALVWLDWVANVNVVGEEGRVIVQRARIEALQRLLADALAQGRTEELETMLVRYALAEQLLITERPAEASSQLSAVIAVWSRSLQRGDRIFERARLLRAWADLESRWDEIPRAERPGKIVELRRASEKFGTSDGAGRMAQIVQRRLAKRMNSE